MLAIRMQRTGRKGHAEYRMVVQDSAWSPTSGRVVYRLGNYNPHTKSIKVDKEKAEFYLKNGARPSPKAALLLKSEGIKLPAWVEIDSGKKKSIKNPQKLRKNQPKEVKTEKSEATAEEPADEKPADSESKPVEAEDKPAEAESKTEEESEKN